MVKLVRAQIDKQSVVDQVSDPYCGAIVTFDGVTRNHNQGRTVLHLDYTAYEEMAVSELEKLRSRALHQWPIHEVAIVHRLGRVRIGESSVFIAVASAHRAEAFEACSWLIDNIKKTVPIWKKEFFEGGEVWIETQDSISRP